MLWESVLSFLSFLFLLSFRAAWGAEKGGERVCLRWKTPRYPFDSPQNSWFDYLQHLPESTCLMGAADAVRMPRATLGLGW